VAEVVREMSLDDPLRFIQTLGELGLSLDVVATWPAPLEPAGLPWPTSCPAQLWARQGLRNSLFSELNNMHPLQFDLDAGGRHFLHYLALAGHFALIDEVLTAFPPECGPRMWNAPRAGHWPWWTLMDTSYDQTMALMSPRFAPADWDGEATSPRGGPLRRHQRLLHLACTSADYRLFHFFCRLNFVQAAHGLPPLIAFNSRPNERCTPLQLLVWAGRWDRLRPAIAAGADVNASFAPGAPPILHLAVDADDVSMLYALLELGADHTLRDAAGFTALLAACQRGRPDCAEALLLFGANRRVCTSLGRNVLDVAQTSTAAVRQAALGVAQLVRTWRPSEHARPPPIVPPLTQRYDFARLPPAVVLNPTVPDPDAAYAPDQTPRRNPVRECRTVTYGP
jgi:hypothetical protein